METLSGTEWNMPEFSSEQISIMRKSIDLISQNQVRISIKVLKRLQNGSFTTQTNRTLVKIISLLHSSNSIGTKRAVTLLENLIERAELPILLEDSTNVLRYIKEIGSQSQWTFEQFEQLAQAATLLDKGEFQLSLKILLFIRREVSQESTQEILDRLIELIRMGIPRDLEEARRVLAEFLRENRIVLMSETALLSSEQRQTLEYAIVMSAVENTEYALELVNAVKTGVNSQNQEPNVKKLVVDLDSVLHHLQEYLNSQDERNLLIAQLKIREILWFY
jgi:hypothetical protein